VDLTGAVEVFVRAYIENSWKKLAHMANVISQVSKANNDGFHQSKS